MGVVPRYSPSASINTLGALSIMISLPLKVFTFFILVCIPLCNLGRLITILNLLIFPITVMSKSPSSNLDSGNCFNPPPLYLPIGCALD